jgi:hypothetical protein
MAASVALAGLLHAKHAFAWHREGQQKVVAQPQREQRAAIAGEIRRDCERTPP